MRQTIRTTLRKLEDAIRAADSLAVRHGELGKDTPVEGDTRCRSAASCT